MFIHLPTLLPLFLLLLTPTLTLTLTPTPPAQGNNKKPLVESNKLRRLLTRKTLLSHADQFVKFSQLDPDGNRAFGGVGHNLTVKYIHDFFASPEMSKYWSVGTQSFVHEYAYGETRTLVEGKKIDSSYFTYAPGTKGVVKLPLGTARNLGCTPEDYPDLHGKIALVSRGSCEFGLKSVLAGKAGAEAVLIYNNVNGTVTGGTFGAPVRELGPYIPGAMISLNDGLSLLEDLKQGEVLAEFEVKAVLQNRTTTNVFAETRGGDKNNIVSLGGHTDSVGAGPGINDNGSGSIALLTIAQALTHFSTANTIRLYFWTAEEFGLVGSKHYIANLPASELAKIKLYLNFDMLASPNYVYFVYDGSGTAFNLTGPPGSAHIERMFTDYFSDVGWKTKPTAFDGRSDYGPFLDVGIASGGLFTGAERVKTKEEREYYGGMEGVAYDENYHKKGDDLLNCNVGAWIVNTKAVAHAVAVYGRSLEGIPERKGVVRREKKPEQLSHGHCGHVDVLE